MGSIRMSEATKGLFLDFRYRGSRCREYTALEDTPANRKKLQKVLDRIESEIAAGTFDYKSFFPNSKAIKRLARGESVQTQAPAPTMQVVSQPGQDGSPLFSDFANQWVNERSIEWRRSHTSSLVSTLNGRLIPHFGKRPVGSISKADILAFRAELGKVKGRGDKEGLSPKRINEIIGLLRQILNEAAERFAFTSPATNIKTLRLRKTDVDPFSLDDVQRIIANVRADYRNYFIVRFFTGMRTGEVHGLKWQYVDFERRIIRVRETFVLGEDEYTKTDGSQRDIQMSQPVWEALMAQQHATAEVSPYVFCNLMGQPLDNKNFTDRVWYPLLRYLDLTERRPYQMRHTAATLWLAAGEAPEWIARQLGHTSTEMLFRVYSRYVPNLTRQDGSAMERLLASRLSQGPLIEQREGQSHARSAANRSPGVYVPMYVAATQGQSPEPRGPQSVPRRRGVHAVRHKKGDDGNHDPQPPPFLWRLSALQLLPRYMAQSMH